MLPLIGKAARRAAAALAAAEAGASSIEGARVLGPQWSIARVAPRVGSWLGFAFRSTDNIPDLTWRRRPLPCIVPCQAQPVPCGAGGAQAAQLVSEDDGKGRAQRTLTREHERNLSRSTLCLFVRHVREGGGPGWAERRRRRARRQEDELAVVAARGRLLRE
jgi:hypothetical protein